LAKCSIHGALCTPVERSALALARRDQRVEAANPFGPSSANSQSSTHQHRGRVDRLALKYAVDSACPLW